MANKVITSNTSAKLSIEERKYNLENSIGSSRRYDMKISVFKNEIKELIKMKELTICQRDDLYNKRYLQTKSRATKKNQLEKKRREKSAEQELLSLENKKKQLSIERINLELQIEEIKFEIRNINFSASI